MWEALREGGPWKSEGGGSLCETVFLRLGLVDEVAELGTSNLLSVEDAIIKQHGAKQHRANQHHVSGNSTGGTWSVVLDTNTAQRPSNVV